MEFVSRNYSDRDPNCRDGDEFVDCNLAQTETGTVLFKDCKGLSFVRCNLARALVPKDSLIEDCNVSQEPLPEPLDEKTVRIQIIDTEIANLESEKQALLAEEPRG